MIDKELLKKELLNIFKKKKILAYELYKEYLKGNYEDIIIDNRNSLLIFFMGILLFTMRYDRSVFSNVIS